MPPFTPHEAPARDLAALPVSRPERPVGRDDVLRDVYAALRLNTAVMVSGAAGLGKTSLAAALAAAYAQQPGGVLWLSGSTSPLASLLVRIGRAYGAREISNSEQPSGTAGAVAALLAQHKPLIVLDDFSDAMVVQSFIKKCADNLPLLLLSETPLQGSWQSIPLMPLSEADAVTLFKHKAGINEGYFDEAIAAIARLLQERPYPLVLAARAMVAAKQTPPDFLNVVSGVARANNGHPDTTAVAISYRALHNALQGLILVLGAMPRSEASAELVSMASGTAPEVIDQTINILSQLYLVERFTRYGRSYYRLHKLVAEYALRTLRGSNRLEALQETVRRVLMTYVEKYSTPGQVDHERLAAEMDNIMTMAEQTSSEGDKATANRLVSLLVRADDFFKERGYLHELLTLRDLGSLSRSAFPAYEEERKAKVDLDEDDPLGLYDEDDDLPAIDDEMYVEDNYEDVEEEEAESSFRRSLLIEEDEEISDEVLTAPRPFPAEPVINTPLTSDPEQLRQALHQARQARDLSRQAQIMQMLGKALVNQGKTTEAIATYNDLVSVQEQLTDDEGLIDTLDMLAALLVKNGSSQAAIMHASRGVQLATAQGSIDAQINLLLTLGDAQLDLGQSENAARAFSQALELARNIGDEQHEALALYKLGTAHLDNGDADAAIHTWEQARDLFKAQLKRDYEGRVLGGLGNAYADQERWLEAIGYYKSALYIAREVGDREEEGIQLSNLASAQMRAGQLADALLTSRQALHVAYQSDDRDNIVAAILDLVRLMIRSNRLLGIARLLIQDAENLEPNDRDVIALSDEIETKLAAAAARGIEQAPVQGTARDYAANAYALLES
ncbi:tetratricopeptide repeat protein [Aggregatilineales bacterium SYSU G02658]